MANIYLHNRKLESIFELLGANENDITFSIGWVLSQCPSFLSGFLAQCGVALRPEDSTAIDVRLQSYKNGSGITDVEIIVHASIHAIIEAKRGLQLPCEQQLRMYASRLREQRCERQALVAMAECSPEYAKHHLPHQVDGLPVHYLCWKDIDKIGANSHGSRAENRLLSQLRNYLRRIVNMQNQESNMVYVVALGSNTPPWSKISWRQIVNDKHRYFHPAAQGGGWPKEPPNYIAFRYGGQLQSIHHVDSWKIVEEMHTDIPEIDAGRWKPHYIYTLGSAILPSKQIKTGNIFPNGRKWAMLDLLLTCGSISEAAEMTKKRMSL